VKRSFFHSAILERFEGADLCNYSKALNRKHGTFKSISAARLDRLDLSVIARNGCGGQTLWNISGLRFRFPASRNYKTGCS